MHKSRYNLIMKVLLSIAMLLAPLACARAQEASTVPPRLLSAKTACIHMIHGTYKDMRAARKELKNWGHYKLVEECSKADLTVHVIARYAPEVDACGAVVQVQDTADNAILWTGNQKCKTRPDVVVSHIFRDLRKEVTKAEGKATKAEGKKANKTEAAAQPKKSQGQSQHHP